MSETQTNIYKVAREYAGMSRVNAAEELAISASCLKDYEIDLATMPGCYCTSNVKTLSYTVVTCTAPAKERCVLRRFWAYPSG